MNVVKSSWLTDDSRVSADLERTPAAVTRHSFYDTPLTCFQYGAPNRRFTSEMGRDTIPLWMECGARSSCRMGLRLTD